MTRINMRMTRIKKEWKTHSRYSRANLSADKAGSHKISVAPGFTPTPNASRYGVNSAGAEWGFTLIEVMIGVALIVLVFVGLFSALQAGLRMLNQSQIITTAQALATERMELIKNLPFDEIGTVAGIPPGTIPQEETITRGKTTFTVRTRIAYVDDDFDGVAPADLLPTDYKQVKIQLIPQNSDIGSGNPVTFITNISPRGVETTVGGGTLSILVFNSLGQPVPSATVTIQKLDAEPFVNITTLTDSFGRVLLPGAPICNECYFVSVTKSSHSTDRTYTSVEVENPAKPYLTIIEGELTEQSFSIDLLSNLTINAFGARELGFPGTGTVNFRLHGTKLIGTDADANPVYKFDENITTDGAGGTALPNTEWDTYILDFGASTQDLAGSSPYVPIILSPGQTLPVTLSAVSNSTNSLLVLVTDSGGVPLEDASVRLLHTGLGYDEILPTGQSADPDFGQAFFSGLTENDYELVISKPGYLVSTTTVGIVGDIFDLVPLSPE